MWFCLEEITTLTTTSSTTVGIFNNIVFLSLQFIVDVRAEAGTNRNSKNTKSASLHRNSHSVKAVDKKILAVIIGRDDADTKPEDQHHENIKTLHDLSDDNIKAIYGDSIVNTNDLNSDNTRRLGKQNLNSRNHNNRKIIITQNRRKHRRTTPWHRHTTAYPHNKTTTWKPYENTTWEPYNWTTLEPVSYTHLDVYKRQVYSYQ